MAEQKILKTGDFEQMFGEKLPDFVAKKITSYNFVYEEISEAERDGWLRKIVATLLDPGLPFSGEHRHQQWEKGWGENLDEYEKTGNIELIKPRYFGKYPVIRIKQRFIKTVSENFERDSLAVIEDWLFDKYMRTAKNIYEFGCGTGHNLLRARKINPDAELYGLDWAESSQKLINAMASGGVDKKLHSHNFDFFNPDQNFNLGEAGVVYTVAALEQIGDRFKPFLEYLIKQRPYLCVHIEPMAELLEPENLLDYLSIEYFKKRKYLFGFLAELRTLEAAGKIKIIEAKRNYIGSLYIEGYSVVVWKTL